MARWGLLMERVRASHAAPGQSGPYRLLDAADGSREEAETRFSGFVRQYQLPNAPPPQYRLPHPAMPQRVQCFRMPDGWLLVSYGATGQPYSYRLRICRMEGDTGPLA